MTPIDKIKQIISEQIEYLATKSREQPLTSEDISNLRTLAQSILDVEKTMPSQKKRQRIKGDHLSDEELLEYASLRK